MTGLLRRATLLAMGAVLIAGAAMASVPNSTNSDQPGNPGDGLARIRVIGHTGGVPDPIGTITYRIMDGQAVPAPVANSVVILNFSNCPDVRLCQAITQGSVNCGAKTVSGVTDANGNVSFTVVGADNDLVPTNSIRHCVTVTADGVPMNSLTAPVSDINADAGVTLLDVSATYGDRILCGTGAGSCSGTYRQRSDFDDDGDVDLLDVSANYGIRVGGGSTASCISSSSLCP